MIRAVGTYFLGSLLLLLGVLLLFHVIGWDVASFFTGGWWPLIILIPCIIRFFFDGDKFLSFIGVVCGAVLLLGTLGAIDDMQRTLMILGPVVIILFAIRLLANGKKKPTTPRRK